MSKGEQEVDRDKTRKGGGGSVFLFFFSRRCDCQQLGYELYRQFIYAEAFVYAESYSYEVEMRLPLQKRD